MDTWSRLSKRVTSMSDSSGNSSRTEGRVIRVDSLARVEGEGALHLEMSGGRVTRALLNIYEPPRFFEAFLRGRDFREVPDITARICGICPVAYQMSACHALERALGVFDSIPPHVRRLRDLFYCGEWVESHTLHMFLLNLPDLLGAESAIEVAREHGDIVRKALGVRAVGNELVSCLGGRSVHPVGACVGGFYKPLEAEKAANMLPRVRKARDEMAELVAWLARTLRFPDFQADYEFVSLVSDAGYPMNIGRIASNRGLNIDPADFLDHIEEHQVEHSTALHARIKNRGPYLTGPLARLNLNHARLHPAGAAALRDCINATGRQLPWNSGYMSILARGVECVHALALAGDILTNYQAAAPGRIDVAPRAGQGAYATEAPRGLLWHWYRTEADGTIAAARIIPPTSQNQARIEQDLTQLTRDLPPTDDEALKLRCEHLIRNYDPCISCSTHFLRLTRQVLADSQPSQFREPSPAPLPLLALDAAKPPVNPRVHVTQHRGGLADA
jgi:sulfhydrogenase subunit alpha